MVSRNSCRCKTCVVICWQSTFTSIYISTHSLTFWQHYNCTADNILYTTFLLFSLFPDWSRDYPEWSMVNERESLLKMEIFSPYFSPELDIVDSGWISLGACLLVFCKQTRQWQGNLNTDFNFAGKILSYVNRYMVWPGTLHLSQDKWSLLDKKTRKLHKKYISIVF